MGHLYSFRSSDNQAEIQSQLKSINEQCHWSVLMIATSTTADDDDDDADL